AGARRDELPGVEVGVRDGEGARDPRFEPRFLPKRLGNRDLFDGEARLLAAPQEVVAIGRVVPRRRDEQATGVPDAVGRDPPHDRVLDHALAGGNRILDDVTPAGVEEPVETAGRPGRQVAALDKRGREAAHGRVAYDAGPGGAAADDEDFRFERRHSYERSIAAAQGLSPDGDCPFNRGGAPVTLLGTAPFGDSP